MPVASCDITFSGAVLTEGARVLGCAGELLPDVADRRRSDVGRGRPEDDGGADPQRPASASHLIFRHVLLDSDRRAESGGEEQRRRPAAPRVLRVPE